jgi:transposase
MTYVRKDVSLIFDASSLTQLLRLGPLQKRVNSNQQIKQERKTVRILPLFLPKQSPWLNPIEPKWVHGKRNVVESNGVLSAEQLAQRVCRYFGCSYEPYLCVPDEVS